MEKLSASQINVNPFCIKVPDNSDNSKNKDKQEIISDKFYNFDNRLYVQQKQTISKFIHQVQLNEKLPTDQQDRRFKIIAPCGSGKTILMINMIDCQLKFIAQPEFKTIIFLVPTNLLITQMISIMYSSLKHIKNLKQLINSSVYTNNYKNKSVIEDTDDVKLDNQFINNPDIILSGNKDTKLQFITNSNSNKIIISTQASQKYLIKMQHKLNHDEHKAQCGSGLKQIIDVCIMDEAHHVAQKRKSNKAAFSYTYTLNEGYYLSSHHQSNDKGIDINYRIFATATERHQDIESHKSKENQVCYSMNNIEDFGKCLINISENELIDQGCILPIKRIMKYQNLTEARLKQNQLNGNDNRDAQNQELILENQNNQNDKINDFDNNKAFEINKQDITENLNETINDKIIEDNIINDNNMILDKNDDTDININNDNYKILNDINQDDALKYIGMSHAILELSQEKDNTQLKYDSMRIFIFFSKIEKCEKFEKIAKIILKDFKIFNINQKTPKQERDNYLREFQNQKQKQTMIVNVSVLSEGIDYPSANFIIFGDHSIKSKIKYTQIKGRGSRIDPNNPNKTCGYLLHLYPNVEQLAVGDVNLYFNEFERISEQNELDLHPGDSNLPNKSEGCGGGSGGQKIEFGGFNWSEYLSFIQLELLNEEEFVKLFHKIRSSLRFNKQKVSCADLIQLESHKELREYILKKQMYIADLNIVDTLIQRMLSTKCFNQKINQIQDQIMSDTIDKDMEKDNDDLKRKRDEVQQDKDLNNNFREEVDEEQSELKRLRTEEKIKKQTLRHKITKNKDILNEDNKIYADNILEDVNKQIMDTQDIQVKTDGEYQLFENQFNNQNVNLKTENVNVKIEINENPNNVTQYTENSLISNIEQQTNQETIQYEDTQPIGEQNSSQVDKEL